MKKLPKIVIIGAGSASFGLSCLKDAFTTPELFGSEIIFVDLDPVAARRVAQAADRINQSLSAGYTIAWTTERKEALPGADFVIVSIAIERARLWKLDFEIPKKHGIPHVLGENGGPGSVFHTCRNIPVILDICQDMEDYCPQALLINFTNPESRICLAIRKYSKIKAVGLCHQIGTGVKIVSSILGIDPLQLDVKAFGLNHFTWITEMRDKRTDEDLYPLFRAREAEYRPDFHPLSRFLYRQFGLFPTSGDRHLGEFVPYAHEFMGTNGYDFDAYAQRRVDGISYLESIIRETVPVDGNLLTPSVEDSFNIIRGMTFNGNIPLLSANLPNQGLIANLPQDCIVEVPALVSGAGVTGLSMGPLPDGIATLCQIQANIQHLTVDGGAVGRRDLVMQALLVDPVVASAAAAQRIFDDMMEASKPYLPQFSWDT